MDKDKLIIAGTSLVPIEIVAHWISGGSSLATLLGLGATGLVYVLADEMKERGVEIPTPPPISKAEKEPGVHGLAYKLFNGKSTRGEDADQGSDDSGVAPSVFMMDDVLSVIREFNRQGCIYFGESLNGAVAIPLHDLIHVLDVTVSGNGKSNRLRLIMPQVAKMAACYYINPLANKIKPVKDERQYEIWAPVFDLLAIPPVKEGDAIADLLEAIAEEIKNRNEQEENEDFSWRENTIALFVDELPETFARCPQAAEYLDQIGRMGRQYNIQLYLCSQTAQVKDIGLSSAAQANLKTKVYGGGDQISANRTMKGTVPKEKERVLQSEKGLTLMLASGVHGEFVRAPLVTNTGLFQYLNLPAFQLDQWVPTSTTSKKSSVATSLSTSSAAKNDPVFEQNKEALKRRNEAGGSGLEVVEAGEVDNEAANTALTEREQQIINMFVSEGLGMRDIAVKLSGVDGGSAYQKASREVTDVLREYMKSLRG